MFAEVKPNVPAIKQQTATITDNQGCHWSKRTMLSLNNDLDGIWNLIQKQNRNAFYIRRLNESVSQQPCATKFYVAFKSGDLLFPSTRSLLLLVSQSISKAYLQRNK